LNIELDESIDSESRRAKAIAKIASDHYEAVLKGNPFMYSAKIGMVEMKLERSSGKKAKKRTSKIIKSLSKKTPEECYSLALNEKVKGKTKKAIKYIEKAISMDEENVFYHIKLLDIMGIDSAKKAVDYLAKNYPEVNVEYFGRKDVSTYAFFNFK
jgi:tetratricopeptide (TPR) repeat protein